MTEADKARLGLVLDELAATLEARRAADPSSSYVAKLHQRGLDTILKKIGEEATEVVIAGKSTDSSAVVYEMADLWFHCLVLLSHLELGPLDVLLELSRRTGTSGLTEKASRTED